jgi:hypothetical protein
MYTGMPILRQSSPFAGDSRLQTLMLQCSRCATIFSSGMAVSNGGTIAFENCYAQCPRCGSLESIPDGLFQETVEGIARLLRKSQNPLQEVGEILGALKDSSLQGSVSPLQSKPWYLTFKKWLPDTPEKIAAYVTIFAAMHQILTRNPSQHIEYSPTFIEQYNQTIIYPQPALKPPSET